MITINLFTSGRHTQPLIEALKRAENIQVLNIYKKLPNSSPGLSGKRHADLSSASSAILKRDPETSSGLKVQNDKKSQVLIPEPADFFIVADFGQIIDKKTLASSKYGSLCVHPSLLPKYRGASPVQSAIINGDKETGVTIIEMDEKVDHGPILVQSREKIKEDDTSESLYERLFAIAAENLINILPDYVEGKIKPTKQNHKQATYTKILTREDGKIDWQKKDKEIERFIRGVSPWPGAWTKIKVQSSKFKVQSKRLKILRAHLERPTTNLVLDEVQLEGKKPVTWKQFKEGYPEAKFVKSN